jgi:hypothetical protein
MTTDWYGMNQNFIATFLFESQYPIVDQDSQTMRQKVFEQAPNLPFTQEGDEWTAPLQQLHNCCCVSYMISIMHTLIINPGFVINRVTRHQ